jgi:uncharacterized membrane protein YdjX (TVP38/TMEM64 family)
MKPATKRLAWVGGAALLVAAAAIALAAGHAHDWADQLEDALEQRGLLQGLAIFCAATVVGTLLMAPAWVFAIAAGAAFGFGWGLLAAVAAQAAAAQCALLLTRHALRDRVGRAAQRNKSFKAIDRAVRKEPWKVVALLRLAPVLPSGLKSYFLGLTCVTPLDYASASVLATLPTTALKVYVGAAGRDVLAGGGPLHWAALAAAVIAMLGVGLFVGRFAKSRLGF